MNKRKMKKLVSDLVDLGNEVYINVHVGQFHEPSFRARTKEEVGELAKRAVEAIGTGAEIETKDNGGDTYSIIIRKGAQLYFSFSYKEETV